MVQEVFTSLHVVHPEKIKVPDGISVGKACLSSQFIVYTFPNNYITREYNE